MNNLLSICIPTYNGADKLQESLNRILPYIIKHNINITISDNASTDGTAEVVENMRNVYDNITYWKNEENIGADKNFEKILKNCDSKYGWLMGNDDYMSESALEKVLDVLDKEEDFELVFVNAADRIKNIPSQCMAGHQVIKNLGAHLTMMSCLIFRIDRLNTIDWSRYHDTHFLQTGIVYEILATDNAKAYWVDENSIFGCDAGSCTFLNQYVSIFTEELYKFSRLLPNYYSEDEKNNFVRSHSGYTALNNFRFLLRRRSDGQMSLSNIARFRKAYIVAHGKSLYCKMLATCFIPRFVIKIALNIKHMFKKK